VELLEILLEDSELRDELILLEDTLDDTDEEIETLELDEMLETEDELDTEDTDEDELELETELLELLGSGKKTPGPDGSCGALLTFWASA
jgi:hypothetical protein